MKLRITLLCYLFFIVITNAQIINEAPYILTVDELKNWTIDGTTASDDLVVTEPLAERFINLDTQFKPDLSNESGIAWLPDGMNNFGNYFGEQSQFNLYNFTHWAYIDKLIWFGGTADQTVQLPSAPWTNTAHKNGVKVLGNIFFAPNAFGGSTATLNNFLEKNDEENFVVLPILIEIMEYYGFDGWFINEETSTNTSTALLMQEFLGELTTAVEAVGKEVMWYDAMRLNGSVGWQNRLNTLNSPFVQDDADGDGTNGFEKRVSSSIFINFFWSGSGFPNASRDRAETIERSEFDVFTGADVWPGRNQARFESGGNSWMSALHQNENTPYTSLGVFAPNAIYNNAEYSNFNNDPDDVARFYSEERHMFSGLDRNPRLEDVSGFKGYANWIPASSTIITLPFQSNFNTGHGHSRYIQGSQISDSDWHNIDEQDILPTWQFAFSEGSGFEANYDFGKAFEGGSSLLVEGDLITNTPVDLLLYKTKLTVASNTKVDLIANQPGIEGASVSVTLTFSDTSVGEAIFFLPETSGNFWQGRSFELDEFIGEEIATIGLRFLATSDVNNYTVNVGEIKVHNGEALSIASNDLIGTPSVQLTNLSNLILASVRGLSPKVLPFEVLDVSGKTIHRGIIPQDETESFSLPTEAMASGVYLLQVTDGNTTVIGKFIKL